MSLVVTVDATGILLKSCIKNVTSMGSAKPEHGYTKGSSFLTHFSVGWCTTIKSQ